MKRILIFSLAYYPHVGGAEVALKEITDRISDIEFHLITLNFGDEEEEEVVGNVRVHRVGNGDSYLSKILFAPRAFRAAARLHRAQPFDAFWAMMSYMLFPIVLLRRRNINVPYLLTLQEGDPYDHTFNRWFIRPFLPLIYAGFKNASAVQAISTYLAEWAHQFGYQGQSLIIPNGVDVARFANVGHRKSHIFAHKETPRGEESPYRTTLVTTSRLVYKNAIDDVIRALTLLPASVHFRVYGEGVEESNLKRLATGLGVTDRVAWRGYIDHEALPHALSESDIFIRPSRSEGMGNSFIEAMAVGLPVIATQEGGIKDFLFDAKKNPDKETTGWAVELDSPDQIAEAVKHIIANPEEVARVTATAKKMVEEKYDWNLISSQMQDVFARLFQNR